MDFTKKIQRFKGLPCIYSWWQARAPLSLINPFSAGTDFRRQTSEVDPRTVRVNIYTGRRPIT